MRNKKIWGSILLALLGVSFSAAGQEVSPETHENNRIDSIIVTSQKREETLKDAAASVSVMSGAALEQANIESPLDLTMSIPNFTVSTVDAQAFVYLRGLGSDLEGVGTEGSAAVHLDGVYLGRPGSIFLSFLDIERVEVLRGPQGILYGRNSVGGSINIITAKPEHDFSARAVATFGDYKRRRGELVVNVPVVQDIAALRVAIMKSDRNGYTDNVNASGNDRFGDEGIWAGRASLLLTPNEDLEIILRGDYFKSDSDFPPFKVDRPGFAGDYGAVVPEDPFEVNSDLPTFLDLKQWGVGVEVNWDIGFATLTSVSSYRTYQEHFLEDVDGTEVEGMQIDWYQDQEQFTQELRLTSNQAERIDWMVGFFYFFENSTALPRLRFGPESPIAGPPGSIFNIVLAGENTTNALAGFAEASYHISDSFKVTGGLRYSWESKDFFLNEQFGFTETFDDVVSVGTVDERKTWSAWTPKLGVSYDVTPDATLYATVSKGFKSGGFNALTLQAGGFEPESIWSYEAGGKAVWFDGRLMTNLSAFYYSLKNQQVNTFVSPVVLITNAAKMSGYGFEFEVIARPTSRLDVDLSLGYLRATFDEFFAVDPNRLDLGVLDLKGNTPRNAPRLSGNLAVRYLVPLGSHGDLSLQGDAQYQSRVFFNQFNDLARQKSVTLLNARVEYQPPSGDWSVAVFGKNLTNEKYRHSAAAIDVLGGNVISHMAAPRTWGVQLTVTLD